ncbi:uncharacterized protein C1orf109-like [Anneissia japonica]|uniref:uncharacterized protein C1orf109-like n=1 Tax=Anneissia japonica TaxID=1529436 RepID=UPI0014259F60|nr:uncharacterized protein C1orf109-like [Anneissia japonica]XP_033117374.1 uncharacterized protein C1orf109-like [Anneissia japonica]
MTNEAGRQLTNEAEELVLKQLKKSFKIVKIQGAQWKETNDKCNPLIQSLLNLAEQHSCCQKACQAGSNPVVQRFPDLPGKLNSSLLHSMELVMMQLRENMHSLQEAQKKVSRQYNNSMEVYNRHQTILGLDRVLRRSPTCPAISDMLEWLADLAKIFAQQLALRNIHLDKIRYEDEDAIKSLLAQFKDETITNYLQGNILKMGFFLEGE